MCYIRPRPKRQAAFVIGALSALTISLLATAGEFKNFLSPLSHHDITIAHRQTINPDSLRDLTFETRQHIDKNSFDIRILTQLLEIRSIVDTQASLMKDFLSGSLNSPIARMIRSKTWAIHRARYKGNHTISNLNREKISSSQIFKTSDAEGLCIHTNITIRQETSIPNEHPTLTMTSSHSAVDKQMACFQI